MQDYSGISGKISASEKWQRTLFAIVSTVLILAFVKFPFKRYNLGLIEGQVMHHSAYSTYLTDDLDSDGNSERIYIYNSTEADRFTLSLIDTEGRIRQTMSMINHRWTPNSYPAVFDTDGDGTREILVVSIRNDTVYLNSINLFNLQFIISDLFLGVIENPVDQMAFGTRFFAFGDYNGDHENEIYFLFDAGFGLQPRALFRYDPAKGRLFSTPATYIPWTPPVFHDLDKDGIPELLARSYAPGNVKFETEFTDNRAWIGAFDLEMNYLFPPIPMPMGHGYVYPSPALCCDSLFYALFSNRESEMPNRIFLIDIKGNIINEKTVFQDDPTLYSQRLEIFDNKNYLLINNIGQFELHPDLGDLPQTKLKRQKDFNPYLHQNLWQVDVNGNGTMEKFYYNLNTSVIEILDEDYRTLSEYHLPYERLRITGVYPYLVGGKTDRIMIVTDSGYFFMDFGENPMFWLKYMGWIGIFALSWGFIFLIQYFQRRRMEQNWETEKKLTELQFNTIRNQLNPHFVYNALSAVGYLIEKGQKEEAYDFLSVNTRLIRKVLEDTEITSRTLRHEINFVKDYLKVQEFRFQERFKAILEIDPDVDMETTVPKMVIHTYVENAIKHGFRDRLEGGILTIQAKKLPPRGVFLTIHDNGDSDGGNTHPSDSNGKGIKIMEAYYRLFEKQYQCKINTSFTRNPGNSPGDGGTSVEIKIEFL